MRNIAETGFKEEMDEAEKNIRFSQLVHADQSGDI